MIAETVDSSAWVNKFEKSHNAYQRKNKKLQAQLLTDESIPDLDRAVLGLTGSPDTLKRYQALAAKLGGLAGHPMIKVSQLPEKNGGLVRRAEGGILTGDVDVWFKYEGPEQRNEYINGAIISAEVYPMATLATYTSGSVPKDRLSIRANEDCDIYSGDTGNGYIGLGLFEPNYATGQQNSAYTIKESAPHEVLLGRDEIYSSEYFLRGIHTLLSKLEVMPKG